MGIHGFTRFLNNQFKGVSNKYFNLKDIDTLLIDCNSLFHKAAEKTYYYGKYKDPELSISIRSKTSQELMDIHIDNIISLFNDIIKKIKPSKNLVLAPDGVVNCGKLAQQKTRRFRKPDPTMLFNTSEITPGTPLMIKIDEALKKWIETLDIPMIFYSSHLVYGEGEHKIFDIIRDKQLLTSKGKTILMGADRDLFVLSAMSDIPNLVLWGEEQKYNDKVEMFYDISYFKKTLFNRLKFDNENEKIYMNDFCILITFLGNDFLPLFPSASGDTNEIMTHIINLYKSTKVHLTTLEGDIIWENILMFFKNYEVYEDELYCNLISKERTFEYIELEMNFKCEGNFNKEKYRDMWYKKQFSPASNALRMLVKDKDVYNETDIYTMCISYLKTLQWVLKYYSFGDKAISNTHFYPYYYTPLIPDVVKVLETIISLKQENILNDITSIHNKEYNCIHQLYLVLPIWSKYLIPEDLQEDYDKMLPINPVSYVSRKEGRNCRECKTRQECTEKDHMNYKDIPILPPIDIDLALSSFNKSLPEYLKPQEIIKIVNKKKVVKKNLFTNMNYKYNIKQHLLI